MLPVRCEGSAVGGSPRRGCPECPADGGQPCRGWLVFGFVLRRNVSESDLVLPWPTQASADSCQQVRLVAGRPGDWVIF